MTDIEKAFLSMPKSGPVKGEPADLNDVFRIVEAAEKAKYAEHTDLYLKIFWQNGQIEIKHLLCWDEQKVRDTHDSLNEYGTNVEYLTRAEYLEWVGKQ